MNIGFYLSYDINITFKHVYVNTSRFCHHVRYVVMVVLAFCDMTPIKDLLQLAETSFDLLWQILMCTSDELKAQDM